jgi:hypothetical protein
MKTQTDMFFSGVSIEEIFSRYIKLKCFDA